MHAHKQIWPPSTHRRGLLDVPANQSVQGVPATPGTPAATPAIRATSQRRHAAADPAPASWHTPMPSALCSRRESEAPPSQHSNAPGTIDPPAILRPETASWHKASLTPLSTMHIQTCRRDKGSVCRRDKGSVTGRTPNGYQRKSRHEATKLDRNEGACRFNASRSSTHLFRNVGRCHNSRLSQSKIGFLNKKMRQCSTTFAAMHQFAATFLTTLL